MVDIDEFRKYLNIDKLSLDDELIRQPTLLFEVAEAHVQAISTRDELKEQLETTNARLDSSIRATLEKVGGKVTESIVKNNIQTSVDHKEAYDAYAAARDQAAMLAALREAFADRGHRIRDLCQLYVASYFEETSVRSDAATDRAAYAATRQKLADARQENGKRNSK